MAEIAAIILDTETTGLTPLDEVIELAWIGFPDLDKVPSFLNTSSLQQGLFRYKPSTAIHPQATAIHGISLKDLEGCPSSSFILENIAGVESNTIFWVGHRVEYDRRMIEQSSGISLQHINLICTHSLASLLLTEEEKKELPNLKLITLCAYFYPLLSKEIALEAHSAMGDCILVLMLLDVFVKRTAALSWKELHSFILSNSDTGKKRKKKQELLPCWPNFGKYRGELFCDIPIDYLKWARDNLDHSKNLNLLYTINEWISKY